MFDEILIVRRSVYFVIIPNILYFDVLYVISKDRLTVVMYLSVNDNNFHDLILKYRIEDIFSYSLNCLKIMGTQSLSSPQIGIQ